MNRPVAENIRTAALAKGTAITAEAFTILSSNLTQAIKAAGITNALPYCSVQAQVLTQKLGETKGVVVRRVSHKARNPVNQAQPAEMALLKGYQAQAAQGQAPAPVVGSHKQGLVTFFAPIVLNNELCLQCHGKPGQDISPENLAVIRKLYPADRATDFKLMEVRGMWRIDFPEAALAR